MGVDGGGGCDGGVFAAAFGAEDRLASVLLRG